jgi:hypothetical protein
LTQRVLLHDFDVSGFSITILGQRFGILMITALIAAGCASTAAQRQAQQAVSLAARASADAFCFFGGRLGRCV